MLLGLFTKLVLLIVGNFVSSDETVEVVLKQGVLSGTVNKTFWNAENYYSFQGIPYAEPPVGELRFQPPKPLVKWNGTFEGHKVKPTCPQFSSRNRNNEEFGFSGSEDCLYINIFTPDLEGNKPVVVFDYNDNFRTSFNGTNTYAPDFFIEENVIIVTISHRFGVLGYLTTKDDVIPANNGLKDYILGLKWIQSNIEKFGGDPKRVTLMGNRGGAITADILLYSKAAKGLFSAVMLHSGTAMESFLFYDKPRQKAFQVGKHFNITTEDSKELLKGLQKADPEELLVSELKIHDGEGLAFKQISDHPFTPVLEEEHENAIITVLPEKGKIVNDVPVIIGMTSREGIDLIADFLFDPRIFLFYVKNKLLGMHFPIRVDYRFNSKSYVYKKNVTKELLDFYYAGEEMNFDNLPQYAEFVGDMTHMYPLNYAAKKLSKEMESPVYYYMFDFKGGLSENNMFISKYTQIPYGGGATVTDELCYLFLCSRIKKHYLVLQKLESEQPEYKVLKKMLRMWTNFIKTRNPTPEKEELLKNLIWQPINKNSKGTDYLHIKKNPEMKKDPLGIREQFWDEFLQKYADLAVNGVIAEGEDYVEEVIEEPGQNGATSDVYRDDVMTPVELEAEQQILKSLDEKEKQKQKEKENENENKAEEGTEGLKVRVEL